MLAAFIVFGVLFAPGCGGDKTGQEKAAPPEVFFDGVLVMRYGDKTNRYEAHITRAAQRLVPLDVENPGAIIIRRDLGVIWNLMPEKKVFLETPIRPEHKNPLVYEPDEILEREVLGEEYVQGIKATKERVVVKNEGAGENTMVRWVAQGLDWPLKAEGPDGDWEMRYEDVIFREQRPGYFEIPEGYSMITARRAHWPGES